MKHLFTLTIFFLLALSGYPQDKTPQIETQLKILDESLNRIRLDIENIENNHIFPVPNLLLKEEKELQKRKDELVRLLGAEPENNVRLRPHNFQGSYENTTKPAHPRGSSGRTLDDHLLKVTRNDSSVVQVWNEETQEYVDSVKSYNTYNEQGQMIINETFILIDTEWRNYSKSEHAFDSDGNQILNLYYTWNLETNNWKGSWKQESQYDADGNRILTIYYSWNSESSTWEESQKYEYEYDAEGRRILYAASYWDPETAEWKGYKSESQYDAEGNQILHVNYSWNSETAEWTRNRKEEFEYNEAGNLTKITTYFPLEEGWEYISELNFTYTFDTNGNKIEQISLYSSDRGATNTNSGKYEYEYDEFGNLTVRSFYSWNCEWQISYKSENSFDSKGNIIGRAYYYSDWQTKELVGSFKYQLILDEGENSTGIIFYQWGEGTNDWIASKKYENELEGEVHYSQWNPNTSSWDLISKTIYYSSVFFEAIAELSDQEIPLGLTIKLSIDDYFTLHDERKVTYEATSTQGLVETSVEDGLIHVTALEQMGTDTVNLVIHLSPFHAVSQSFEINVIEALGVKSLSSALALYPNPAISYLSIKPEYFSSKAKWKLINLSGTRIKEGTIQETRIDLAGYKPGLYILQVYDQERTTNFKFIKK